MQLRKTRTWLTAAGLIGMLATSACAGPPQAGGRQLLTLDFEGEPTGTVDERRAVEDWSSEDAALSTYSVAPNGSMAVGEESGNQYLVRSFQAGTYNASEAERRNSAVLTWQLKETYDEVHLSYRVKVSDSFEAGRGGKLPGLCGGSCPTGGEATDDDGDALGWSVRNMWASSGGFSQYVYLPGQDSEYGEGIPYRRGDDRPLITDSGWQDVDVVVRMNTPGEADGSITGWINGDRYLNEQRIRFRDDASIGVDQILFSNFYGGHDKSWAAPSDARMYFDDITVSVVGR